MFRLGEPFVAVDHGRYQTVATRDLMRYHERHMDNDEGKQQKETPFMHHHQRGVHRFTIRHKREADSQGDLRHGNQEKGEIGGASESVMPPIGGNRAAEAAQIAGEGFPPDPALGWRQGQEVAPARRRRPDKEPEDAQRQPGGEGIAADLMDNVDLPHQGVRHVVTQGQEGSA